MQRIIILRLIFSLLGKLATFTKTDKDDKLIEVARKVLLANPDLLPVVKKVVKDTEKELKSKDDKSTSK